MTRPRLATRLRQRAGAFVVDNFFRSASALGKLHPRARPHRHGVSVCHDIAYTDTGLRAHRLDIYRPRVHDGLLPVVFYVHGGGFRILSKDTHWLMGLAFARAGYMVVNISYRLAPRHPFPSGLQDCVAALQWVLEHAQSYGGDTDKMVFAGESAGANLVTALTLMGCYRRPEPWAQKVFDSGVQPLALLPYCGVFQVSDAQRFKQRRSSISTFVNDRLLEVSSSYLGHDPQQHGATLDLADPLVVLERGDRPDRPLPPCFVTVGTKDPLLDDTRRLESALSAMGVEHEAIYYPGEVHAFHAMVWRDNARRCWRDTFRFLNRWVPS